MTKDQKDILKAARLELGTALFKYETLKDALEELNRLLVSIHDPDDPDLPLVEDAVSCFGLMPQMAMLEEECIELALAVHKWRNRGTTEAQLIEVAREIADVELMLIQVLYMYSGHQSFLSALGNARSEKRQRLRNRIYEHRTAIKP